MKLSTLYTTSNLPYVRLTDTKSSGTAGTTYNSGAYRTVTLNTENEDAEGICTLSSNQFELAAGNYAVSILGQEPAITVNFSLRLRTSGGTTLYKWPRIISVIDAASRPLRGGPVAATGRFTVAASTPVELQVYPSANWTQVALSDGENEVYWTVELVKLD